MSTNLKVIYIVLFSINPRLQCWLFESMRKVQLCYCIFPKDLLKIYLIKYLLLKRNRSSIKYCSFSSPVSSNLCNPVIHILLGFNVYNCQYMHTSDVWSVISCYFGCCFFSIISKMKNVQIKSLQVQLVSEWLTISIGRAHGSMVKGQ